MKKFLQKKLKEQKGMTLIELLAVIVIIAIIAAIAIPAIGGIIDNSRVGAAKSDAQNILSAGELYFIDNAKATVTLDDLVKNGFVDDMGSFEANKAGVTVYNKSGATPVTIEGTGTTGKISVKFEKASRDNIEKYGNSDRGAVTDAPNVVATKAP